MATPFQGAEVDHVEFPAGKIRFYRAGTSGPAIILLHGGGPDNALLSWWHSIPVLAVDHRVYAPELPGHGGSFPWHGRVNQRTLEEVLRWLLETWNLTEVTLVGLSLGGSVATGFTLRHPQRVRGLVLVGSGGLEYRLRRHLLTYAITRSKVVGRLLAKLMLLHRSVTRRVLLRSVFAGDREIPDLEAIVDEVVAEARTRGSVFTDWQQESINRRSMSVNHLPYVDRIRCPTMLIHGEQDPQVPVATARLAADAITGSDLRILPNTGHWPNREKPAEFNALLREFVTSSAS